MYYLQSRYYDSKICRFINADSYVSTGQGVLGYNMFAYCGNNPVNYVDYTGEWFVVDDIAPLTLLVSCMVVMLGLIQDAMGDQILGNFVSDVVTQTAKALTNITNLFVVDTPKDEAGDIIITPQHNKVVFPANPNDFNPVGLVKVFRNGTKNGMLISWMDPVTHTEIFRWDENPNFSNGSHYHIIDDLEHYYAGDIVPDPYATIYFPLR